MVLEKDFPEDVELQRMESREGIETASLAYPRRSGAELQRMESREGIETVVRSGANPDDVVRCSGWKAAKELKHCISRVPNRHTTVAADGKPRRN